MSFFGSRSNGTSSPATGGEQGSFFDNLANGAGSEQAPEHLSDPNLAASAHHYTGSVSPTKLWSPSQPPSSWMQRPPPPTTTGVASSFTVPAAQSSGAQRPATGSEYGVTNNGHLFGPPPPRRAFNTASSISSSLEGSPTTSVPPLMRPPPPSHHRTTPHTTLSPSGSIASLSGAGGIASRYALAPTAAALEASATRLGAPSPSLAASANGASNPTSLNPSPVPLGSRLSTFVNSERTKSSLQRLAPAASWLVAGASKIGSFVTGPDAADTQGPNESTSSPDHSQSGIAPDTNSSNLPNSYPPQALSPSYDAPPPPLNPPQRPPWPRPGLAPPLAPTSVLSTPPPANSVPEATSSVPLNTTPTITGGSNKSSTGAALAVLADSTDHEHSADAHARPASVNDSPSPSWLDSTPNQHAEEPRASPQPLKRLAPAAQWLLAGAGKAAKFVTGIDRAANDPDQPEHLDPSQQPTDWAPAGAYSREPSTQSQSDSQLPALDGGVPSSHPTGELERPAADTAAQEEHYAGVSALLAAADTQSNAESTAEQSAREWHHRSRDWGFGSFFTNRQGSRNPSFSANLDISADTTVGNGRAPPPPVSTRISPSAALLSLGSPGTATSEQGSTVIHPSPHAPSPSRPPLGPSWAPQQEVESNVQQQSESSQPAPHESEAEGSGWAAQRPTQGWGHSDAAHTGTHASVSAAEPAAASNTGDAGYGWLSSTTHAPHDSAGITASTGTEQVWEGQGQGSYSGDGLRATGRPLSPVAVRPKADPKTASLSGGGWLSGVQQEDAEAEDVAVDSHGDVQYADTPRAGESCTTPFRAGAAETFAGGGGSFFEDPGMQLDAATVEAEAPGSFFGTATTPRAANAAVHAVATGAPAQASYFDETMSHTPRAGDLAAGVQQSFFDETTSQTPRAGELAAGLQQQFFGDSAYTSTGAADTQQQEIAEAEDVTVDAYGEVQYASTPTPRTVSGTFFGDTRPVQDPSMAALQPHEASQHAWGDGGNRWGGGGPSSFTADAVASAEVPAAAEEHGFDTQTTAEGASKSGDGTTDHQFNSILRNAGLHVRTEVGSEAPAAAVVPQNHAFYAPTDIQHQEPQHIMSDSAFVTDSQSQAMPLGTDHLENAEHRPHAEHPYAEHPHVEYPQYPASAAHSSAAGVSVAADMQVKSTNDAITAAPPPDMHEVPPSASDMRAPDESEGGTQGRNGLVTGVDADSAAQDILAPGMGALAGLAGMVGWGKKSHQGDPAQNHSRSASQLSQQLPDPATLTPPEAEFTPPPKAPAAEESLGGFPAAFALTQTIENPLWSPNEQSLAAKPPLPSTTLARPPPPPSTVPPLTYGSSGSLGSAPLPHPPAKLPPRSTAGTFGSVQITTVESNSSLPHEQTPSTDTLSMPPTAWERPQAYGEAPTGQQHQAAALHVSSTTEMSEVRTSAESAEILSPSVVLTHSTGEATEPRTEISGSGGPTVATSPDPSNPVAGSNIWSRLQGLSDSDQLAQGLASSGMTFPADSEVHQIAGGAPALPPMPAVNVERSSMHGSESNGSLLPEKRYSSGTEYSMSKLPESSGLSALAPGPRPPLVPTPARSTPGSSPRARSISASGEKSRALQQYVAALESDKYELQRGLKRQMELVRQLADDQQDAENALEASRAEAGELREELSKTNAALMEQAQVAAAASHTAEAAQQAVQDVLDGRTLIVEENVALEEQLLSLRNEAAAAQQQHGELESRVAAAASDIRAVQARADTAAKRAEQDRKRLHDEIEELKEGRTTLLGRIRDMALRKNGDSSSHTAELATAAADAATKSETSTASAAAVGASVLVSGGATRQVVDAACQCSGAWGDVEMARRTLGRGLSHQQSHSGGQGLLEDEMQELQDPVSLRVAEQAGAVVAARGEGAADQNGADPSAVASGTRENEIGSVGLDSLEGWRALLPPVGRGSGIVAAVADTQVGVLDNVHSLLDRVAKERVRSQQHIAAQTAEIELLRAAVVAAGAVAPQCGIWHNPTQQESENGKASGSADAELQGPGDSTTTAAVGERLDAPVEQGGVQALPREQYTTEMGGANGVNGSVADLKSNGVHHQGSGDEIENISEAFLADPVAIAQHLTPTKSIPRQRGQPVDQKGPVGSSKATPSPSRGRWFGGMFGRSPSKSPQATLLNSA